MNIFISNFPLSRARDLDLELGSGHFAHRHASFITSTYIPNFVEIEEETYGPTDVWTDVQTDKRTDGRTDI